MCWRDLWSDVSLTSSIAGRKLTALGGDDLSEDNSDGSVENSSKIGSSKRDPLSRMSVFIAMEETVETVEGVLVKVAGDRSGDSMGVTTVVEVGTCNRGEAIEGGTDGYDVETDVDTIAVGVRERDDDEEVIDGDSLEGLSSIVLSRVRS
jgi:hypothetical protein